MTQRSSVHLSELKTPESDVDIVLAALDPCVATVDLMHRVIRWCSPAFEAQFALSAGDSMSALQERLPEAKVALNQLFIGGCPAPVGTVPTSRPSRCSGKTSTTSSALPTGTVTAKLVRPGLALLKVQLPEERPDEAMRRHLQDRERLLFTSRRLSVSEMASTLAHELNQPIGTVANVLRGVKSRLDSARSGGVAAVSMATPEALSVGVQMALDQALFASRIIARIRSYTQSRQPQGVRLGLLKVLQVSVALLDWEIDRDRAQVQWNPTLTDGEVMGDEVMLQQVMINLLRNALEAMRDVNDRPRLLTLQMQLQKADGTVHVQIRDNGCGLPAGTNDQLFVPFQSTKPDGMGIGLNICRSFVELHQGRLWCTNNHSDPQPGPGLTFHLTLPLCKQERRQSRASDVSASRQSDATTPGVAASSPIDS